MLAIPKSIHLQPHVSPLLSNYLLNVSMSMSHGEIDINMPKIKLLTLVFSSPTYLTTQTKNLSHPCLLSSSSSRTTYCSVHSSFKIYLQSISFCHHCHVSYHISLPDLPATTTLFKSILHNNQIMLYLNFHSNLTWYLILLFPFYK